MSERRNPAETPNECQPSDTLNVPNRRDFLKSLLVAGVVGASLLSGCARMKTDIILSEPSWRDGHLANREVLNVAKFIKDRYGVVLLTDNPLSSVEKLEKAVLLIGKQLAKYPPDLIYKSKIKKIKITEPYSLGYSYGGWISIAANEVSSQLHHEIAHEIYKSRGRGEWDLFLKHWGSLNAKGLNSYSLANCRPSPRPVGFTSWYGQCHLLEDIAEISEGLFASISQIEQICNEDPVVAKKVRMWKDELYRLTNGRIGPQYWEDLKAGKVNEKYWDKH